MQESKIIKILNENNLSDIEVLKRDDEFVLINFLKLVVLKVVYLVILLLNIIMN